MQALEAYEEALKIRRKLAEKNPNAYLSSVATTLNNLAILHEMSKECSKALKKYEEALKIRKQLAKENPNMYLSGVAITLNNLAILHCYTTEYPQAFEAYEEALKIRRELAEENPKVYLSNVTTLLNNLSKFYHDNVSNKELSMKYASEAVEILGRCNNLPFVREELERAKQIIEKWNNK